MASLAPGYQFVTWTASTTALASAPFKNALAGVYKVNTNRNGLISYKPASQFNNVSELVFGGVYLFVVTTAVTVNDALLTVNDAAAGSTATLSAGYNFVIWRGTATALSGAAPSWRNSVGGIFKVNVNKNGFISYKPVSQFNNVNSLETGGMYLFVVATAFDLAEAVTLYVQDNPAPNPSALIADDKSNALLSSLASGKAPADYGLTTTGGALMPLPNFFQTSDTQFGVFVGNTALSASNVLLGPLDGSTAPTVSPSNFTTFADNVLLLYLCNSHGAGGVNGSLQPYSYWTGQTVVPAGIFVPFDAGQHIFGQAGAISGAIRSYFFDAPDPNVGHRDMPAYVRAAKASGQYTRIFVILNGNINNYVAASYGDQQVKDDHRYMARALALAGAEVILSPDPPTVRDLPGGSRGAGQAEFDAIEARRQSANNDFYANYADYEAVAVASFQGDAILDNPASNVPANGYPSTYWADDTHPSNTGYQRWVQRAILPALFSGLRRAIPVNAPPTGLATAAVDGVVAFTKNPAVRLAFHEQSIDSGTTWTACTVEGIVAPPATYAAGLLRARVAAFSGAAPSVAISNASAITVAPPNAGFQDAVLTAFSGTPVISDNNWTGAQANYVDAPQSTKGFNGNGALRLTLKKAHRKAFHGLSQAGLNPTSANIALRTAIGTATLDRFYPYSFGGQQGETPGYNYADNDIMVIQRIGTVGRIMRDDGNPIGLYNGTATPDTTVPYIDLPGCFNDNLPVRYLGVAEDVGAGGDFIQLKADAGLSVFTS